MGCTFHRPAKRTLPPSRGSRVGGRGAVLSVVGAGVWRGEGVSNNAAPVSQRPPRPRGDQEHWGFRAPGSGGDRKTRLSARAVAFLTRDPGPRSPAAGPLLPLRPPHPALRHSSGLKRRTLVQPSVALTPGTVPSARWPTDPLPTARLAHPAPRNAARAPRWSQPGPRKRWPPPRAQHPSFLVAAMMTSRNLQAWERRALRPAAEVVRTGAAGGSEACQGALSVAVRPPLSRF